MKILVCGINYSPDLIGIAKYTGEMCEWLAGKGHTVRMITAQPYYPYWRVPAEYRRVGYSSELLNGVSVTRCPLYVPKSPTGLRRILHHASFATSMMLAMSVVVPRFRPDIVLAIAPSILSAPAAWLVARCCGAAAWLHVQDFEVDAAFGLDFVTGSRLRRVASAFERLIFGRFDRVSAISPEMVKQLTGKGTLPSRRILFRNWADTAVDISAPPDFRSILKALPDSKLVLYSGNMGTKQGLEYLVSAACKLEQTRSDILFVFCGAGPMRTRLLEEAKTLSNVRFLDLQPREHISSLLAAADIHLLPQRAEATGWFLPSKLGNILASGRPVVAMAHPGTQIATEVEDCGVVIPPGDIAALVTAVEALADNQDWRSTLGQRASAVALERWNKRAVLEEFEDELLALQAQRRRVPAVNALDRDHGDAHKRVCVLLAQNPGGLSHGRGRLANRAPSARGGHAKAENGMPSSDKIGL